MMKITNEDKIALLELLGCDFVDKQYNFYYRSEEITKKVSEFNPLDISILMKALDIIEKRDIDTNLKYAPVQGRYFQYIGQNKGVSSPNYDYMGSSLIREEAILKAILTYIKQKE